MPDDGLALPLPTGEQEHRLPSLPGEPLLAVTMAAGSTTVDASQEDLRGLWAAAGTAETTLLLMVPVRYEHVI
jgi:hypothetical protein